RMPGHMNRRERKITEPTFTVTPEAAAASVNQFLRERFSRALVVESTPDVFFGFYNFDVKDSVTGAKYGMLSVNGSSGQVWYDTWHGTFVQSKELNQLYASEQLVLMASSVDEAPENFRVGRIQPIVAGNLPTKRLADKIVVILKGLSPARCLR